MKQNWLVIGLLAAAVNMPALAADETSAAVAPVANAPQPAANDEVQKLGTDEAPAPVSPEAQSGSDQPAPTANTAQPDSSDANPPPISEAEKMLWMGDQLKLLDKPTTLKYDFKKIGSFEEGFSDSVKFHINQILPDGMKRAEVDFFSGQHHLNLPPYDSINGNVLLAIYLQGDILEMNRLTDIGSRYFQQKIKYALATNARISDTEIEFGGSKVAGKIVSITPYADDSRTETSEKFHKFKDKSYAFTVSDAIPGYLYEIHTSVPAPQDAADKSQPLNDETLRLTEATPLDSAPVATAGAADPAPQPKP